MPIGPSLTSEIKTLSQIESIPFYNRHHYHLPEKIMSLKSKIIGEHTATTIIGFGNDIAGWLWNDILHTPRRFAFDICIYHGRCPDGIGGAFPFWRNNVGDPDHPFVLRGAKYKGDSYPKEKIAGQRVVIVDFSYTRKIMKEVCREAKYVLLLDHHETAQRDLADLEKEVPNFGYIFDTKRSGAQISWDWCYPNPFGMKTARPWFIEIIADRDLWKWEHPHSKAISKALHYLGWYTWERMETLLRKNSTASEELQKRFTALGEILLEIEEKEVERAVKLSAIVRFEGFRVRIATCTPNIRSEVGNTLSLQKDCDFAAVWRYCPIKDQWWVSLRGSDSCLVPLNRIAEKFGGGGHPKACGFVIYGKESFEALSGSSKGLVIGNLRTLFKAL